MDKASLQFSQLQADQHQKFARIKMKQTSQAKEKEALKDDTSMFGISDNLNLNMGDTSVSSTVGLNVTLEAANTAMREEVRELQDETGRLRKSLAEREYEIKRLNKKIMKCEEEKRMLSDAGLATDSASTKIVELSKKNRELSSLMESERSKSIRLQQKVNDLERKLLEVPRASPREDSKLSKSFSLRQSLVSSSESVESLQDQLSSANLKVSEYRNQVQALKQDMKVALKVLTQETGESQVTIQSFLNNNGQGYRGRAQQVIALQDKVKELEQKLKTDLDFNPKMNRNLTRIKDIERSRKDQIDALKEDLTKLQDQYSDAQRKLDGAKARNKILTSEVKSLKSQISVLSDKGSHDNELIATLMKQQEKLQKLLERTSATQDSTARNEAAVQKELYNRKQQETSEIKKLKELLTEREARVRQLEAELLSASDSLDEDHKPLSVFNSSTKITSEEENSSPKRDGEVQYLRQKCVEFKALYDAAESERQQMVLLINRLNLRNEESVRKLEETISRYNEARRRCVSMEQRLEASNLPENSDKLSSQGNDGINELRAHLAIQKDENNALKEALESTLRSKEDELKMFQEMTEQTKQVFLDALRSFTTKQQNG